MGITMGFLFVCFCLFLIRDLDILECITFILVLELFTCKKVFMIFCKLQCAILYTCFKLKSL